MRSSEEVALLTPQQLRRATGAVARAFQDDPWSIYILPDPARRARLLPQLFAFTLRYAQLYGAVYTTPDVAGASCWLLPAHTLTFGSLLRSGALALPFQIGLAAIRRLQSAETYNEAMHQRVIGQPHNYLWLLGVDPASQGRGNGGKLIQVGLERADAAGLPCYLETSNPKNVTLYQKYGFEVAEEGVLPGQGPHVWAMKRMP